MEPPRRRRAGGVKRAPRSNGKPRERPDSRLRTGVNCDGATTISVSAGCAFSLPSTAVSNRASGAADGEKMKNDFLTCFGLLI